MYLPTIYRCNSIGSNNQKIAPRSNDRRAIFALMHSLELRIVFYHFLKRNRFKVVDVTPCVQNAFPGNQQRPVIHISILVDVSMNHVTSGLMIPAYHREVTQGKSMLSITGFQIGLNADEPALQVHLLHPLTVMIAGD